MVQKTNDKFLGLFRRGGCVGTEDCSRLDILNLQRRDIVLSKAADQLYYCIQEIILITKSHVMRKPTICICENKDADQLRGNREADQRLCFRYLDSTIPLLPKSKISSL